MIDYKDLHAKIKAKLRPDSPMMEGYVLVERFAKDGFRISKPTRDPSRLLMIDFRYDFHSNSIGDLEWFASILQIPLEDNGYTDLVKAAELEIEINTKFRAGLSDEEMEEWESYSNDGEIALQSALERIKNDNP